MSTDIKPLVLAVYIILQGYNFHSLSEETQVEISECLNCKYQSNLVHVLHDTLRCFVKIVGSMYRNWFS